MRTLNTLVIGSMLLGLMGTAHAEGGAERARQFHSTFMAEQARLWNDDAANSQKQRVAQTKPQQDKGGKERIDDQTVRQTAVD